MENMYDQTNNILKKYHIVANKSLGQNFLINDEIIKETVNSANITNQDLVIEIGPGVGNLTNLLLQKAKKVIAIELDKRMIMVLKERFCNAHNFELINEDVLKVNLKNLIKMEKEQNDIREVKVVANLPYYITTPIIMKLLEDKLEVKSITVMVQKEVADRLTTKPGEKLAGAITYSINYYAEAYKIVRVPKENFIPIPDVESMVIQLVLRDKPKIEVKNEETFFKLIKISFMQRRKTFLNGVSNSGIIEKEKLKQILQELEIPENIRGENLSLEQFSQIVTKME